MASRKLGQIMVGVVGVLLAALGFSGCATVDNGTDGAGQKPPMQVMGQPGAGQQLFGSDEDAAKAIVEAAKASDKEALGRILGPAMQELVSGDPIEDKNDLAAFAAHAAEHMRLEKKDPHTTIMHLGARDWPLAVPIAQTADGKWFFDTEAGKQEVLARRVGHNELETIKVCRAYVDAQREYASKPRDGSNVLRYAQRMVSHPGEQDGLYWDVQPGADPSPFGPLMAQATEEGYDTHAGHRHEPYYGYYFRVLKEQGPAAPGGAYDYVINGNMIAGFAIVAWPANYGASGVTTFIVNHYGKVYEKDLGPDTENMARAMQAYNPDDSWRLEKD